MPKYAKNTINSETTTPIGIDFCGVLASSPAVAMQSKPINPKKHLAAPVITPLIPYGAKPPLPCPATSVSDKDQFEDLTARLINVSVWMLPHVACNLPCHSPDIITVTTTHRFTTVKILLTTDDSLAPNAMATKNNLVIN